jgi:TolB-like protein
MVPRVITALLVLGIPVAVTVAWYHGDRGAQRVTGAELAIIALLLLIGAALLVVLVRPAAEHEESAELSPAQGTEAGAAALPALAPPPASGKPRLAILPFQNLSPDPDNAFFADGLQEDIIATLARAPELEVISRTTMLIYRAAPKPIPAVAAELGATHVIEGSVRRAGERVRLSLQLIDGRTDNHLWSETYDRTLKDALTLQTDVAKEVAAQLAVQLGSADEPLRAPTSDPEAYDLFLKARLLRKQLNPLSYLTDTQRIDSLLARAVARDPDFGLAYVERANHGLSHYLAIDATQERLRQVRADLDAAGRLIPDDPTLKSTEVLYRRVMEPELDAAALIEATQQPGVDPLNLYFLTVALAQAGRFDESLSVMQRWETLDPANIMNLQLYAALLAISRKPKEALRVYDLVKARADLDYFAAVRAYTLFAYTGKITELRAAIDREKAVVAADVHLGREFDALRLERRFAELKRLLSEASVEAITPGWSRYLAFLGTGRQPVAEMRGWVALLMGDAASAAAEARALHAFIAASPALPTNARYLCALGAEAHLFAGENAQAVDAMRACLTLAPRARDAFAWSAVTAAAAAVLAWADAADEAVALLEELSRVEAGLGPAEITRDPLYHVPLADNPRYRALKEKLEAQMAATRLE